MILLVGYAWIAAGLFALGAHEAITKRGRGEPWARDVATWAAVSLAWPVITVGLLAGIAVRAGVFAIHDHIQSRNPTP